MCCTMLTDECGHSAMWCSRPAVVCCKNDCAAARCSRHKPRKRGGK
jgi:hypothetical protein